jgi:hypothetical protein
LNPSATAGNADLKVRLVRERRTRILQTTTSFAARAISKHSFSSATVIIRYPGSVQLATGGTVVITGGYAIHTFTSSGTFTVN